jgi:hypothetical protein
MRTACVLGVLLLSLSAPALAIPGATDRTPAASLLVPFFETGIDVSVNPDDTLLSVINQNGGASQIIHYHAWDIDGNATALRGNVTLPPNGGWNVAMRDLLNGAAPAVRAQLTEGAFYRGFVTIDVVTAGTLLNPRQAGYPFSTSNAIEGYIYYTRLAEGSANGLAMVAIESVPAATDDFMQGFYRFGPQDDREEIDATARRCAHNLATAAPCGGADPDLDRFHLRIFRSTPLSGQSRAIIFTWLLALTGGPSPYCDNPANACASSYLFRQFTDAGTLVKSANIRLDHVVNVIPNSFLVGNQSGWISIVNVPDPVADMQVYALSFNSANPSDDPDQAWDAIFEGYIDP